MSKNTKVWLYRSMNSPTVKISTVTIPNVLPIIIGVRAMGAAEAADKIGELWGLCIDLHQHIYTVEK